MAVNEQSSTKKLMSLAQSAAMEGDEDTLDEIYGVLQARVDRDGRSAANARKVLSLLEDLVVLEEEEDQEEIPDFDLSAFNDVCEIELLCTTRDDRINQRRQRMIESAERSVWLSSYSFWGVEAKAITEFLIKAAKRGVAVTVVLPTPPKRRDPVDRRLVEQLNKRRGIQVHTVNGSHSKVVVSDMAECLVGSANAVL